MERMIENTDPRPHPAMQVAPDADSKDSAVDQAVRVRLARCTNALAARNAHKQSASELTVRL
jgi:hypothetical protein